MLTAMLTLSQATVICTFGMALLGPMQVKLLDLQAQQDHKALLAQQALRVLRAFKVMQAQLDLKEFKELLVLQVLKAKQD
jgi:hypothetical protein